MALPTICLVVRQKHQATCGTGPSERRRELLPAAGAVPARAHWQGGVRATSDSSGHGASCPDVASQSNYPPHAKCGPQDNCCYIPIALIITAFGERRQQTLLMRDKMVHALVDIEGCGRTARFIRSNACRDLHVLLRSRAHCSGFWQQEARRRTLYWGLDNRALRNHLPCRRFRIVAIQEMGMVILRGNQRLSCAFNCMEYCER